MNNTRWIYKNNNIDKDIQDLGIDKDIVNILLNRKIDKKEKIQNFFSSHLDKLKNPFSLADMQKSIDRVLSAIDNKELIYIYGDYDVDGITSTSISYLALKALGANVSYYIPLRDEGYGINNEALKHIKEQGAKIVISVDCGISSIKEALYAKELGLDLIITDHHEITSNLPEAYAIINPKRKDQEYDFSYLAGCGTIFLFIMALYDTLGKKEETYKYIDIVAIGTIADIVPLVEENRIIAKNGLEKLKNTENIGLSTLLPLVFEDYHNKEYTSYDVGFLIAPIFNAAGRLEDAKRAVELLITPSKELAHSIALNLIEKNNERKELQKDILEAVEKDIFERELYNKEVIVCAKEEFHHGVIGIVASKIVDKYYKPTIIMEIKRNEGFAVASCRSIEDFHVLEGLVSMKELFIKFGGHAGAAGFSIPIENISEFEERINAYAKEALSDESFLKPILIDKEILFSKISYNFFNKLEDLKPFGFGNHNPTFAVSGVILSNVRQIGKDKTHLMLDMNYKGLCIKNCVWFGNGHVLDELKKERQFDIAFKPKIESYMDKLYAKVFIEDIKESINKKSEIEEYFDLHDTVFPLETIVYSLMEPSPSDNFELNLENSKASIFRRGKSFAFLDDTLSYTLNTLKNAYGFKFTCKLIETNKTNSNYQSKIVISKDESFSSLSFKTSDIFKDIKNHLLPHFPYNSMQKEVLGKIFKENKNVQVLEYKNRGVKTLINTIVLYYKTLGKKVLLISTQEFPKIDCDYSDKFKEGYDFYIFYEIIPEILPEKFLIFSQENLKNENISLIETKLNIPNNIKIVEEQELLDKEHIYSIKLPLAKRLEIYKSLDKFQTIYGTKDLLKLF